MRLAPTFAAFAVAVLLASPVAAQTPVPEPVAGLAGHAFYDLDTGIVRWDAGPAVHAGVDVYRNLSTPTFGFSSEDFFAVFGDRITTTGTGLLEESAFTIFNSPAGGGPLYSSQFGVSFRNGATNALLGEYTTGLIDFGNGLQVGQFAIVTVTGLAKLQIDLTTTDVLVLQRLLDPIGETGRLGVVIHDPPAVGSSDNKMYIQASTVGPPGFYTIGIPPLNANPGYRVATLAPVPTQPRTWGHVRAATR